METYEEKDIEKSESPKSNNRLIIGLVVALLLVMCCCIIVVAVLAIDPFDWNVFGFLTGGGGDVAVESMPEDTALYVGLDMDQLTPVELGRLLDPFLQADQTLDYNSVAAALSDLDDQLEAEAGFNLSDDILPWIGPTVGIGIIEYDIDQFGGLETAEVLVVAETKDKQAADDFLQKLITGIEESRGETFRESEYEGVTIYELDSNFEEDRVAAARSGDTFFFGTGADAIQKGIDAQQGTSLAENDDFSKLEKEMSADRAMTLFFSAEFAADSTAGPASGLPVDPTDLPVVSQTGGAMTVSIIDPGVQFDFLSVVDVDQLDDAERLMLEGSDAKTADMFPEDTVIYFSGPSVNQFWQSFVAVAPDYNEAMDELSNELGFDVVNDFIVHLDGETGIGMWPSSTGLLADAADIALAFAALSGTSNEEAVISASENIASTMEDEFLSVDKTTNDGLTVFTLSEPFSQIEAAFGAGDGYFFIASGSSHVDEIFGGESSLADSELYNSVWSEFPGGTSPVLYVDMKGISSALEMAVGGVMGSDAADATAAIRPIEVIAMGSDFSGDVSRGSLIIFLAGDE